jgi:hypothetical protein
MVYLFHLYNSGSRRDVIYSMVVYFFHLRYRDPRPQEFKVLLYSFSHLHELHQRGGVMKPNERKSAKDTLCR